MVKRWTSNGRPRVNRHTGCVEIPFPDGAAAEMDDALLIEHCELSSLGFVLSKAEGFDVLTIEAVPRKRREP